MENLSLALEERTIRKVKYRVLPLVFAIYLVAFLDRANVAYAKLTMSADLGFSEKVYGFGAGLFFIGYLVLEVPGALIVQRWGARRWISRILASWGVCTAIVGLIHSANQFLAARFLLGLAEAGLVPGVLVYLNAWFPVQHRARALTRFFIASPVALMIGGPIAGVILRLNWGGIAGWRWVFILEGVPALILAIVCLTAMSDRPQDASWLEADERDWLVNALETERRQETVVRHLSVWQVLRRREVLLLSAITFLVNIGIAGFFLWLPSNVRSHSGLSPSVAAALSGIPYAVTVAIELALSYSSDRTGERRLHSAVPLLLAAVVFPVTTLGGLNLASFVFWLCLSAAAIYGYTPAYWTLPSLTLKDTAGAAAYGFLNLFGAMGSFIGPSVVGTMLTRGIPFSRAVLFLSACFLIGGICALRIQVPAPSG